MKFQCHLDSYFQICTSLVCEICVLTFIEFSEWSVLYDKILNVSKRDQRNISWTQDSSVQGSRDVSAALFAVNLRKIEDFHTEYLCSIIEIRWYDFITNQEVLTHLRRLRIRWINQLGRGSSNTPLTTLWRHAIVRDHGSETTHRPSAD